MTQEKIAKVVFKKEKNKQAVSPPAGGQN